MGRLLARAFRAAGHAVAFHDPGRRLAGFPSVPLETAAAADAVVVSVSLEATPAVLAEVFSLSPPGLVLDVASVKGPLLALYARAARRGLSVASVHPMFGPGVRSLEGQNLIVCDAGVPAATRSAARLFAGHGLILATITAASITPSSTPAPRPAPMLVSTSSRIFGRSPSVSARCEITSLSLASFRLEMPMTLPQSCISMAAPQVTIRLLSN